MKPIYLVLYEEMKNNLERDLRGMADFLNINCTETDILCTLKNQRGNFFRAPSNVTIQSVYSPDVVDMFNKAIDRVLALVQQRFPKYSDFRFPELDELYWAANYVNIMELYELSLSSVASSEETCIMKIVVISFCFAMIHLLILRQSSVCTK